MNTKEFNEIAAAYAAVYSEAEQLDENRMASRMGKMPSAPAKVGKATHSIKDLTPSREPSPEEKAKARKSLKLKESDIYDIILSHLLDEGYADTQEQAQVIMVNMSEDWRESIVEGIVDKVASTAGSVVGTVQRAAREVPKYVQQKVNNVAGSYEYARQKADNNSSSGSTKMTAAKNATMSGKSSAPRSREFSHGGNPGMSNPGPNFGR
jgi:hypothetical protein